ncbi:polymer-forming cytoskeletal protein [Polaromonas sp.]|uniref:polymer-forming cytoskeletal protein n=1 Tax=Polaromonas sp. TaxID=1869339 RepID=UPI003263482D
MTESYTTYAAFAFVCLLLLTLPFVAAFREWLRPTDMAALPISANYTSDIDHFARRLRADAQAKLGQGAPTGYEDFDLLPAPSAPAATADWRAAKKRLIARGDLELREPLCSVQQLYVEGNVRAGAGSAVPALYATGDIHLGAQSEIQDWAHAEGVLRLGHSSVALRRVSAGVAIELGNEAWFERMYAPTLRFGSTRNSESFAKKTGQTAAAYSDLPNAIEQTPMLFLIRGDCALPPASIFRGSLVVTGFLTVGAGTTVVGDIKAREGVSVGPGAKVEGALTCEKRVYVFPRAHVHGPVISESDILVGAGALIGLPEAETTVSACNIIVEDGVVMHGMIWAREIGMVKQA